MIRLYKIAKNPKKICEKKKKMACNISNLRV